MKVVKNKVAPPFKEVEFDIIYNEGISKLGDLVDLAVNKEIIKKTGAWFNYDNNRVQGRDGVKKLLNEDAELLKKLYAQVKDSLGMNGTPAVQPEVKEETTPAKEKKSK